MASAGLLCPALETDLVEAINAAVGGTVPRGIHHIQIEKGNRLELGLLRQLRGESVVFWTVTNFTFCELARRRDHLTMDGTLTPAESAFRQLRLCDERWSRAKPLKILRSTNLRSMYVSGPETLPDGL
jgi:hypothetical protein